MVDANVLSNDAGCNAVHVRQIRRRRPRNPQRMIDECRRLRSELRLSNVEISRRTGASKHNVEYWLRDDKLTSDEVAAIIADKNRRQIIKNRRKDSFCKKNTSQLYIASNAQAVAPLQRGRIAEAAVTFRLALFNFEIYQSVFGAAKIDMVVRHRSSDRLVKIQVKAAQSERHGAPSITLTRQPTRGVTERYGEGDFDFIVGYDVATDEAYVFHADDCASLSRSISATESSREAWGRIVEFSV